MATKKCPTCELMVLQRLVSGVLTWAWHNDRRGRECPRSGRPV